MHAGAEADIQKKFYVRGGAGGLLSESLSPNFSVNFELAAGFKVLFTVTNSLFSSSSCNRI